MPESSGHLIPDGQDAGTVSRKESYAITLDFVTELLRWYADGKSLPRRYVWEIVLGAYGAFKNEESMVEVTIGEGETVNIIGDVHGKH